MPGRTTETAFESYVEEPAKLETAIDRLQEYRTARLPPPLPGRLTFAVTNLLSIHDHPPLRAQLPVPCGF